MPSSALSRETEEKDIEFSAVNLSAKKFPGSMVVLNYLHVSNIFNSGIFFLIVLITKMQCPWGRDPAPWPATFRVSFIIVDGTLWSAENTLSWHASRL